MTLYRRDLLTGMSAAALGLQSFRTRGAYSRTGIKAIAFDAFAVFDPRPLLAAMNELYPEKGADLAIFGARGSLNTHGAIRCQAGTPISGKSRATCWCMPTKH
jgi:hypothetical protein